MKIIGKAEGLRIVINGKEVLWVPFITKDPISCSIFSAHFILANPFIFMSKKILPLISSKLNFKINSCSLNLEDEMKLKNQDLFRTEISEFRSCTFGKHKIDTGGTRPIAQQMHRFPIHQQNEINDEIEKLLRLKIIQKSKSPWRSQIVPIPKPDGSTRLCIDFRALNKATIKDSYPVPRIEEIIDNLQNAKYFSILDATSGYYQLNLDDDSREKTAFSWKTGHYEFVRMPFGLCNAPATFQRAMDEIFQKESGRFVFNYLDDTIVFSKNEAEHKKHLDTVFGKIRSAGLSLNPKKCKLFRKE
ncbi:LTR retrotransposon, partial [Pseudoloma neurophilia]